MSFNSSPYPTTGRGVLDEAFISPVTPSGQVLFNGAVAEGAAISAMQNKTALYPLPKGAFLDWVRRNRQADIIWTYNDNNQYVQSSFERYTNTDVVGLSSINGQGDINERPDQFLARIQFLGLAFMNNDVNGTQRFNIHCGGLYTILNVSNRHIVGGDWLRVYAPSPSEMKEGGRGEEADASGGVMTLWFIPYHPEVHQQTPRHVHACLSQLTNDVHTTVDGKSFMHEYEDLCTDQFDAYVNLGLIFVKFLAEAGQVTLPDHFEAKMRALLTRLGHRRFHSKNGSDPDMRQELIDAFFLQVFRRDSDEYKDLNYFSDKQLQACQREAVSMDMYAKARFIHTINKDVVAKAITSMAPKKNGQVQLCRYMSG